MEGGQAYKMGNMVVVQCHNEMSLCLFGYEINGILVSEIERQEDGNKVAGVQWYISLL